MDTYTVQEKYFLSSRLFFFLLQIRNLEIINTGFYHANLSYTFPVESPCLFNDDLKYKVKIIFISPKDSASCIKIVRTMALFKESFARVSFAKFASFHIRKRFDLRILSISPTCKSLSSHIFVAILF